MEVVENGIEKMQLLQSGAKKQVLLALGCNSVINAKEEIDRNTLELPEEQEMLLDRIAEVNPNTVLVLFTNYPYTLQKAMEKAAGDHHVCNGKPGYGKRNVRGCAWNLCTGRPSEYDLV